MKLGTHNIAPAKAKAGMQLNENCRFILIALGVFFLTLGAAVLLFMLIGMVFFAVGPVGSIIEASLIAVAFGAALLLVGRRPT